MNILGCNLVRTCEACPEQYDVYLAGEQIGYLRLRWGYFRAEFPDVGGTTVYTHAFDNEEYMGIFDTDEQRDEYLTNAVSALLKHVVERSKLKWDEDA